MPIAEQAPFAPTLAQDGLSEPARPLTALGRLRALLPEVQAGRWTAVQVAEVLGVTRGRLYQLRNEGNLDWPPRRGTQPPKVCSVCGSRLKASNRSGLCRAHWFAKREDEAKRDNYRPGRARRQALRLVRELPNKDLREALEMLKRLKEQPKWKKLG